MELFNRNSGSEVPPSQVEYQQDPGRNWRALVIYLILALLVAALVVFSGRWVYQQLSNNSDVAVAPKNSDRAQRSESQGASGEQGKSNNPAPAPSPSPGGSRSQGAQSTPSPTPSNLPNNGPGHVAALFIGTSFVAGSLHYLIASRRFSRA